MRPPFGIVLVLSVGFLVSLGWGSGVAASKDVNYRHAYYLFLRTMRNQGSVDCYIPLLMTAEPLDRIAKTKQAATGVVITTYERDSVVGSPREVVVAPADVEPPERYIRLGERHYRYHEVNAEEVVRLLEHPEGTILIHRTLEMGVPPVEELRALTAGFRRPR